MNLIPFECGLCRGVAGIVNPQDERLAVSAGFERSDHDRARGDLDQRTSRRGADAGRGEERFGALDAKMRRRRLIIRGVRADGIVENRFPLLFGAVIGVPMVVHHPRINRGGRLDRGQVGRGIRLRTGQVRRQPADFQQRRFGRWTKSRPACRSRCPPSARRKTNSCTRLEAGPFPVGSPPTEC